MTGPAREGIIARLRALSSLPLHDLMEMALAQKIAGRGDRFSLCTIMNVKSGRCSEDCAFCAQSARYRTTGPEYPLRPLDEIVERAMEAAQAGAERFSLVASGKGPGRMEIGQYAKAIRAVRDRTGLSVCASLGIADAEGLGILRDAGLSRYHHNIETSRGFYGRICTTHGFDERVETILAAKSAGLEVCSGGIIGIGETLDDRIDMAAELACLDVDSSPLNILVPIPGTPLSGFPPLPVDEVLRTIAIFRMALPGIAIRIAGGRESLGEFQAMAFMSGADAMLVGGYLTVRGRAVEDDVRMVSVIRAIWGSRKRPSSRY